MSENKTAEEILYDNIKTLNGGQCLTFDNCLLSMQEYANQQNQELQRQVEEYKNYIKTQKFTLENDLGYIKILESQYTQLKEAADEKDKVINEILELENTNGTPNIDWIFNQLKQLTTPKT